MKQKNYIVWPIYNSQGKLLKDGTLNGRKLIDILRECRKEANTYVKKRFPEIVKTTKAEKIEIQALWDKLDKKQQELIATTKVLG